MGRPAFTRFLTGPGETAATAEAGVRWDGRFATWDALLNDGRERAALVRPRRIYLVDPAAGLESLVSLLAVATVPDTVLLWAEPTALGVPTRRLAPGLAEVVDGTGGGAGSPDDAGTADGAGPAAGAGAAGVAAAAATPHDAVLRGGARDRPLWGVTTSGSSGRPKFAIGYADAWELIALHYERAIFATAFPAGMPPVLATCLPLRYSAAFFMTVLPALFLRRDLVIFSPQDWTPVQRIAATRDVFVLGVPALAAAACLGTPEAVDMRRAALFLGGGHLSAQRVALIRERFTGVSVANLYGTAETGAMTVDPEPGHNEHVGRPIDGKAVWLEDPDEQGVGTVAAAGPDCCRYTWRPGEAMTTNPGYVTGTDYGRFDERGHLCLLGRVDGGEKVKGMLIYPRAIERHLLALDGVADARVSVRRTETGLEHLEAKVIGEVDEAAVREHCSTLAEAERPTRIECVPEATALAAYNAVGKL